MRQMFKYSVIVLAFLLTPQVVWSQPIIANHLCIDRSQIPSQWIDSARAKLNIAYGHTSHGSQIVTGMDALLAVHGDLYNFNSNGSGGAMNFHNNAMGGDVGYYPDWVDNTRNYLGAPNSNGRGADQSDVNIIMWSWCGQASNKSGQTMIDEYLAPMSQLEREYPGVRFVYMTGHLDGGGAEGSLNINDQQIRSFCIDSNKILFDFMDIESYDPDGLVNYMPLGANDNCDYDTDGNGSRDGNWANNWISANPESELAQEATLCSGCAHSQGLNCAMKGRAIWWLWARLAGWNGGGGINTLKVNPASLSFGNVVIGSASNVKTYTIIGSNLTPEADTITITAPPGFSISTNSDSEFVPSMKIAYTGGILSLRTIYVKFSPVEVLDYTNSLINIGGGASDQIVSVSGIGISASNVKEGGICRTFELCQNYPNPFNPQTVISYKLSAISNVSLKIFDILGREVANLVNEIQSAGEHTVQWNGRNSAGQKIGSGVYFYQIRSGSGFVSTKKMMMLN